MDNDTLETFTENVQSGVKALESAFESAESFEEVSSEAENLWMALDEGEDVIDELDLTELPDIVDAEELSEAIEFEDVPEAISEGDPKKAIDTWSLVKAIELRELWGSTDMRELWRESREFDDAIDEFTDDSDDGDGEMLSGMDTDMETADIDNEMESQLYQSKIQSELHDSVEAFREKLLETRNQLARIKQENEAKGKVGQPNSRNPAAYSTLSSARQDRGRTTQYSTVPREAWHSSSPNSKRIYGERFEEEDDA